MVTEVIEKTRDIVERIDNDISQTTAGIDQIVADADTEAAGGPAKPGRTPAPETIGVLLKLRKQHLLLIKPCKECLNHIL
ncbi:hypothetical protein thsrh120_47360 [Rhizobium sp. No.120]